MKFTFVGDGDNDPDLVTLYGVEFPLGEAVEVSDPKAIGKLRTNANFREGVATAAPAKRKPGRPPKAPLKIVQVDVGDDD